MEREVRLFVVEDHAIVRAGVKMLLEAQAGFTVVGEAATGGEALAAVPQVQADVVLLDLSLPDLNGIEVARLLRDGGSGPRLVALSMHEDAESVRGFLQAGGAGYVPKSAVETQLIDAIRAVTRGEYHVPAYLLAALAQEVARPAEAGPDALTGREREVVQRIAEGCTYRQIAADLGIGEKTVATYRERAAEKLGLRTRAELVRFAIRHGLLE